MIFSGIFIFLVVLYEFKLYRKDNQIKDLLDRVMSKTYGEYIMGKQEEPKDLESHTYTDNEQVMDQINKLKAAGITDFDDIKQSLELDFETEQIEKAGY